MKDFLACVPGKLSLSGLDAEDDNLREGLLWPSCLWDTGTHSCSISDDLPSEDLLAYLQHPIHDPYKNFNVPVVQVDASFSFPYTSILIKQHFHSLTIVQNSQSTK